MKVTDGSPKAIDAAQRQIIEVMLKTKPELIGTAVPELADFVTSLKAALDGISGSIGDAALTQQVVAAVVEQALGVTGAGPTAASANLNAVKDALATFMARSAAEGREFWTSSSRGG